MQGNITNNSTNPNTQTRQIRSSQTSDIFDLLYNTFKSEFLEKYPNFSAEDLDEIKNIIWVAKRTKNAIVSSQNLPWDAYNISPKHKKQLQEIGRKYFDNTDNIKILFDALLKLGNLREIGGLISRGNFFEERETKFMNKIFSLYGQKNVDGIETLDLDKIYNLLKEPIFESIITTHPTNSKSFALINIERKIATLLSDKNNNFDKNKLKDLMKEYLSAEPLPARKQTTGRRKLNVEEEIDFSVEFLSRIYNDVVGVYSKIKSEIPDKSKKDFDPINLDLGFRFGSWGSSGDKDGNNNVNADTTILAVAKHKQALYSLYLENLKNVITKINISPDNGKLPDSLKEKISLFKDSFSEFKSEYDSIVRDIKSKLDDQENSGFLSNDEMDNFIERLSHVEQNFKISEFKNTLIDLYKTENLDEDNKEEILNLIYRARIFKTSLGHIEYRENSEEISTIVKMLLGDDYKNLNDEEKEKYISDLLNDKPRMEEIIKEQFSQISKNGNRKYDANDPIPLAYHTLKRLEIAGKFPEMIQNHVIAEFKNTHNGLELLLLEALVNLSSKSSPKLHIVPLFESGHELANIKNICGKLIDNPTYKQYLKTLSKADMEIEAAQRDSIQTERGSRKYYNYINQQIQLAHSDNARRMGLTAARIAIHEAHQTLGELEAEHNIKQSENDQKIKFRFFQGGGASDTFRGGVRSVSAMINAYNMQNYAKLTIQGVDNCNLWISEESTLHSLLDPVIKQVEESCKADRLEEEATKPSELTKQQGKIVSHIVKIASKKSEEKYCEVCDIKGMGKILGELGRDDSNFSSRGSSRKTANEDLIDGVKTIDPSSVRTITYSKKLQYAGIIPTWIGFSDMIDEIMRMTSSMTELQKTIKNYEQNHPDDLLNMNKDAEEFLKEICDASNIDKLRNFYENSLQMRDVVDRVAYGGLLTEIDKIKQHELLGESEIGKYLIESYDKSLKYSYLMLRDYNKQTGTHSIKRNSDYYESIMQEPDTNKINAKILNKLPYLKPPMLKKLKYKGGVNAFAELAEGFMKSTEAMPEEERRDINHLINSCYDNIYYPLDSLAGNMKHRGEWLKLQRQ